MVNSSGSLRRKKKNDSDKIRSGATGIISKQAANSEHDKEHLSEKLRLAASHGSKSDVYNLLSAGAGFTRDKDGRSALHYAVLENHVELARILVNRGCDIDAVDKTGHSCLQRAASLGHVECTRFLVESNCLVDQQDFQNGNSALHESSWYGFSRCLELLTKAKSNVFLTNKSGFTALHLAAQNGHNQCIRLLLYAGCDPHLKNNYGDTALHTAGRYGHAGVSRILLSANVNINEQNKNGDTALHIAAALQRRKITRILLDASADTSIQNKQLETAGDIAQRKEYPEVLALIAEHSQESIKMQNKNSQKIYPAGKSTTVKNTKQSRLKSLFFWRKNKKDKKNSGQQQQPNLNGAVMTGSGGGLGTGGPGAAGGIGAGGRGANVIASDVAQPGDRRTQLGLFDQYIKKDGTCPYQDLAGNIRQGPIGYAPVGQFLSPVERDLHYNELLAARDFINQRLAQLDTQSQTENNGEERPTIPLNGQFSRLPNGQISTAPPLPSAAAAAAGKGPAAIANGVIGHGTGAREDNKLQTGTGYLEQQPVSNTLGQRQQRAANSGSAGGGLGTLGGSSNWVDDRCIQFERMFGIPSTRNGPMANLYKTRSDESLSISEYKLKHKVIPVRKAIDDDLTTVPRYEPEEGYVYDQDDGAELELNYHSNLGSRNTLRGTQTSINALRVSETNLIPGDFESTLTLPSSQNEPPPQVHHQRLQQSRLSSSRPQAGQTYHQQQQQQIAPDSYHHHQAVPPPPPPLQQRVNLQHNGDEPQLLAQQQHFIHNQNFGQPPLVHQQQQPVSHQSHPNLPPHSHHHHQQQQAHVHNSDSYRLAADGPHHHHHQQQLNRYHSNFNQTLSPQHAQEQLQYDAHESPMMGAYLDQQHQHHQQQQFQMQYHQPLSSGPGQQYGDSLQHPDLPSYDQLASSLSAYQNILNSTPKEEIYARTRDRTILPTSTSGDVNQEFGINAQINSSLKPSQNKPPSKETIDDVRMGLPRQDDSSAGAAEDLRHSFSNASAVPLPPLHSSPQTKSRVLQSPTNFHSSSHSHLQQQQQQYQSFPRHESQSSPSRQPSLLRQGQMPQYPPQARQGPQVSRRQMPRSDSYPERLLSPNIDQLHQNRQENNEFHDLKSRAKSTTTLPSAITRQVQFTDSHQHVTDSSEQEVTADIHGPSSSGNRSQELAKLELKERLSKMIQRSSSSTPRSPDKFLPTSTSAANGTSSIGANNNNNAGGPPRQVKFNIPISSSASIEPLNNVGVAANNREEEEDHEIENEIENVTTRMSQQPQQPQPTAINRYQHHTGSHPTSSNQFSSPIPENPYEKYRPSSSTNRLTPRDHTPDQQQQQQVVQPSGIFRHSRPAALHSSAPQSHLPNNLPSATYLQSHSHSLSQSPGPHYKTPALVPPTGQQPPPTGGTSSRPTSRFGNIPNSPPPQQQHLQHPMERSRGQMVRSPTHPPPTNDRNRVNSPPSFRLTQQQQSSGTAAAGGRSSNYYTGVGPAPNLYQLQQQQQQRRPVSMGPAGVGPGTTQPPHLQASSQVSSLQFGAQLQTGEALPPPPSSPSFSPLPIDQLDSSPHRYHQPPPQQQQRRYYYNNPSSQQLYDRVVRNNVRDNNNTNNLNQSHQPVHHQQQQHNGQDGGTSLPPTATVPHPSNLTTAPVTVHVDFQTKASSTSVGGGPGGLSDTDYLMLTKQRTSETGSNTDSGYGGGQCIINGVVTNKNWSPQSPPGNSTSPQQHSQSLSTSSRHSSPFNSNNSALSNDFDHKEHPSRSAPHHINGPVVNLGGGINKQRAVQGSGGGHLSSGALGVQPNDLNSDSMMTSSRNVSGPIMIIPSGHVPTASVGGNNGPLVNGSGRRSQEVSSDSPGTDV